MPLLGTRCLAFSTDPRDEIPGVSQPPSALGRPMHILVPAVGFYIEHAWLWRKNSEGMFADWNPKVSCL